MIQNQTQQLQQQLGESKDRLERKQEQKKLLQIALLAAKNLKAKK